MKYLKIKNNGELDIRLVALMGGTTKSKDTYKIGQFGTGLKYTLAYLFRNNLDFKIFVGNKQVDVYTEKEFIRDEEFEIICINGQRTSITTRMGEDWEAWMIVRELWCNALDEGGADRKITDKIESIEGSTVFYIQADALIQKVITDWDKYFIQDKEPLFENNDYKIYPGTDKLRFYKQGVLIYEHSEIRGLFNYDIKNADINELREYKGSVTYPIAAALHDCNEKVAKYFLENINEDYYEGKSGLMDYNWYFGNWNKSWTKVIGNAKIVHKKAVENAQARGIEIDTITNIVVPEVVYKALTDKFPGIGALYVAEKGKEFLEHYDPITENKINQAITILEACNYTIHPELSFAYGFFEDKRILATVNNKDKRICFSNTLIQRPLFDIISTVIEENEHFNTGLADHTREFQQHFIDLYTRALLAQNEVEI